MLDFETTNLDKGSADNPKNELVLACWEVHKDGMYTAKHKWGDQYNQHELLRDIAEADYIVAHNCFSGDTKFITDAGVVSFADSVGTTVNVWNEDGWQKATVKCYGKSSLKKVTLVPYNRSRTSIVREVRATANHRWKVDRLFSRNKVGYYRKEADGYITTNNLRIGDKVWAEKPEVCVAENSDGFRHGLVFADGTKCSDGKAYQLRLCGSKEKYKTLFDNYTYPQSANGDPVVNRYYANEDLKSTPPDYASLEYKAAFIEAWQRMDGTDSTAGTSRVVTTIDEAAAIWLRDNCIVAGYYCTGFSKHSNKSGYGSQEFYMVVLTKDDGMGWTVKSVEDCDEQEDVYCVEVNGLDRFTLDHGIYTGNCKFELKWLRRCGVDLTKVKVFCTMMGQWVLNGNTKGPLSLEACAVAHGLGIQKDSYISLLIKLGVCPTEMERQRLRFYCKRDVRVCSKLYYVLRRHLQRDGLLGIVLTRNLTATVLADVEANGMTLDRKRVLDEYNATVEELADIKDKLANLAPGINLNSGTQLAEFLYDKLCFREPRDHKGNTIRTASGRRSTDSATLSLLVAHTEEQQSFLTLYSRYNKLSSLLSKNLEFFKGVVTEHDDCTFRAVFNQGITATHRLSSSGSPIIFSGQKKSKSVQFQNLPRQYKKLFCAEQPHNGADHGREAMCIGEVDGAQLEFRVAADLGQDLVAIREIETWSDIHQVTADTLTSAGESTTRQQAKASTFAPLYGGMGRTPAQKKYAEFFKKKYAGISGTQREWVNKVVDNKFLITPYGMRYYWPNAKMDRRGYVKESTEIFNFPVQGLATAEIIPIALVHFWFRSKAYDSGITVINTVHDSIICKFPESKEQEFRDLATQALTLDVFEYLRNNYYYEFTCPLGVGIKVSSHWGDTKDETKTNVWPDGRMESKDD